MRRGDFTMFLMISQLNDQLQKKKKKTIKKYKSTPN
jgi:hypothetical protein